MATYKFNTYLDDLYIESGNWTVTQLSSTQITLEGAEFRVVLTGTGFAISGSNAPLGTITSAKVYGYDYASGSPVTSLVVDGSGLNHSLAGFVDALETGDYGGVDFLLNGNDTLNGSSGDDEMTGFGGNDTLNGGDGDDELYGDSWEWDYDSSSLVGGADILNGGNGNDWLDGGAGADTMSGGTGDDVFAVDNAGDKVVELAGQGTRDRVEFDNGQGLLSYTLAANVENLSVFHWYTPTPTVMTAKGNELANKISVDHYYDFGYQEKLYGMAGNDRLSSGGGNDTLDGGTGNDVMLGGTGSDTYYVDSNLDKVLEDIIANPSSTDIDTVVYTVATAGSTASLGGIISGLSNSITFTQIENLSLGASTASTTALNGVGSGAANKLNGNAATNKLYGAAGNDQLFGYGGADQLFGDAGNDRLTGGLGKDTLNGGSGNDIFDFNALNETGLTSTAWDVITDFVRGQDKIDLSTLDANTATTSTNEAFTTIIGSASAFTTAGQLKVANGVLYGNTDTDSTAEFAIALTGISSLTTADFIL